MQRRKMAGDTAFGRLFACVLMTVSGAGFANGVTVSSFGADPADSTRILQKALDAGAKRVVVDKAGSPWVTGPLFVRSNTEAYQWPHPVYETPGFIVTFR
jgi:hypothetical protein